MKLYGFGVAELLVIVTGSHRELLDRAGIYHRLHELQFAETPAPVDL